MSDEPAPDRAIDPNIPSVARVYDYLLGGKDNFESDRKMTSKMLEVAPETPATAKMNKEFGKRACRYMAQQGIRQFIDLGSGIPTSPPSVHDTVRAIQPDATVVYVDSDPVVVSHSRALRAIGEGLTTVQADIRDVDAVLDHPDVLGCIDFGEPVAVMFMSVLQTIPAEQDPYSLVRRVRDRMVVGSFLGMSHISTRSTSAAIAHLHKTSRETGYPPVAVRSDDEVGKFFDGFSIVDPGLVDIRDWWPEETGPSVTIRLAGAVGRRL